MACTVASYIDKVEVYREGAIVTRRATLTPDCGAEILLEHLPLSLDDGSLRARVRSAGDDVSAIEVRAELDLPRPGQSLESDAARQLRDQDEHIAEIKWWMQHADDELALLDRLKLQLPQRLEKQPPRGMAPGLWRQLASWAQQRREACAEQKKELRIKLRSHELRRAQLQRTISEEHAQQGVQLDKVSKRVRVRLSTPLGEGEAHLWVDYRVPGAHWRPCYTLRIARDGSRAELGLRAMVAQRSGEPWDNVELRLATAELLRHLGLPELRSIRIGRTQSEPARRAWRDPPAGTETLFESLDAALAQMPSPPGATASDGDPELSEHLESPTEIRNRGDEPTPVFDEQAEVFDLAVDDVSEDEELCEAPPDMSSDAGSMQRELSIAPAMAPPAGALSMESMASAQRPALGRARGRRAQKKSAPEATLVDAFGAAGGFDDGPITRELGLARSLEVQPDLLDYGRLHLPDWRLKTRGTLQAMSLAEHLPHAAADILRSLRQLLQQVRRLAGHVDAFDPRSVAVGESSGHFDFRYTAAARVDVPSDGRPHNLPLLATEAPVSLSLVVVPRESEHAVRLATLTNPLALPLLAGPTEIFLDDEFLVDSRIDTVPAGGELRVGLGVEEALKVARRSHFAEKNKGLLGGGLELEHRVEIDLASRLSAACQVEVRERVPVIRRDDKDVEVEITSVEPDWQDYKQDEAHRLRGGKRWTLQLEPGQDLTLRYSYSVRIDAKNELVGGNRRERA